MWPRNPPTRRDHGFENLLTTSSRQEYSEPRAGELREVARLPEEAPQAGEPTATLPSRAPHWLATRSGARPGFRKSKELQLHTSSGATNGAMHRGWLLSREPGTSHVRGPSRPTQKLATVGSLEEQASARGSSWPLGHRCGEQDGIYLCKALTLIMYTR